MSGVGEHNLGTEVSGSSSWNAAAKVYGWSPFVCDSSPLGRPSAHCDHCCRSYLQGQRTICGSQKSLTSLQENLVSLSSGEGGGQTSINVSGAVEAITGAPWLSSKPGYQWEVLIFSPNKQPFTSRCGIQPPRFRGLPTTKFSLDLSSDLQAQHLRRVVRSPR